MSALRNLAVPITRALDVVLPPRCLSCQEPMLPPGGLCPDCWPSVRFLAAPLCQCCGIPLEQPEQDPCADCQVRRPAIRRARSALIYDDGSRDLLLRLKHADALSGVPVLARWMVRAGSEILPEADWLVPVPLYWTRLFRRRYNQSAELARAIARFSGVAVLPDGLQRTRNTPSQGGLTRAGRQANVLGAFYVSPRHRKRLSNRKVVLVDDVMTTGATLNACASALLDAGAAQIDALCLARVEQSTTHP